jgi:hypothetical protein
MFLEELRQFSIQERLLTPTYCKCKNDHDKLEKQTKRLNNLAIYIVEYIVITNTKSGTVAFRRSRKVVLALLGK